MLLLFLFINLHMQYTIQKLIKFRFKWCIAQCRGVKSDLYKYVETFFLLQNNQNRQQNKLVNMASRNDLLEHNYCPYLYLTYVFWTQMCIYLTEWYLDLYMAFIFLDERILQFFLKCVYLAWAEM